MLFNIAVSGDIKGQKHTEPRSSWPGFGEFCHSWRRFRSTEVVGARFVAFALISIVGRLYSEESMDAYLRLLAWYRLSAFPPRQSGRVNAEDGCQALLRRYPYGVCTP